MRLKKGKKEYNLPNKYIIPNFLKSEYYKDYKNGKSLDKCVSLFIITTEGLVSISEQREFDELLIDIEREVKNAI